MYKRITKIIDFIFIHLIIYAISFVWIRYYVKNLTSAIFLSLAITVVIDLFWKALTYNKSEKKQLKAKDEKQMQQHVTSLLFLPKADLDEFLSKFYENCYPILKMGEVNQNDVIEAVKWAEERSYKEVNLVVVEETKQITAYVKNISGIDIHIIDKYQLFSDMKEKETYPKCSIEVKKQKLKAMDIVKYAFHKKRAKGYILCGFLLILTSFIIPYKLYYIITGSVLLLIALICLTLNHEI